MPSTSGYYFLKIPGLLFFGFVWLLVKLRVLKEQRHGFARLAAYGDCLNLAARPLAGVLRPLLIVQFWVGRRPAAYRCVTAKAAVVAKVETDSYAPIFRRSRFATAY